MLGAWLHNFSLTKYLISQVIQRPEDRLSALREYVVNARMEDRELKEAGYRVQIIKPDPKQGGVLQFGTEIIISEDKSLATLLGASPGASTSVDIMLHVIEKCYPHYIQDTKKIQELIPSYGKKLNDDIQLITETRKRTHEVLWI